MSSRRIAVYLEVSPQRTFASALDWPGWCRAGRDEDVALEALASYAMRYAPVAEQAGVSFPSTGRLRRRRAGARRADDRVRRTRMPPPVPANHRRGRAGEGDPGRGPAPGRPGHCGVGDLRRDRRRVTGRVAPGPAGWRPGPGQADRPRDRRRDQHVRQIVVAVAGRRGAISTAESEPPVFSVGRGRRHRYARLLINRRPSNRAVHRAIGRAPTRGVSRSVAPGCGVVGLTGVGSRWALWPPNRSSTRVGPASTPPCAPVTTMTRAGCVVGREYVSDGDLAVGCAHVAVRTKP
jgi:hypothetical protein